MAQAARKLRVVTPPRKRPAGRPKSRLTSAVASTERDMLVVLRQKLAAKIDGDAPTREFTSLVNQFRAVDRDIRAIDARAAAADEDDEDDDAGAGGTEAWDESAI